jgi:hypothetical protein
MFIGLHQGLGSIMRLSVTEPEVFQFFFGLHQGLGLIMKLSVTSALILGLLFEVAPVSWPYECEMFDFFFHFFFAYIKAWA